MYGVEFKTTRLDVTFPPLQGEREGGDGLASVVARQAHPPPSLPLEGGGAMIYPLFPAVRSVRRLYAFTNEPRFCRADFNFFEEEVLQVLRANKLASSSPYSGTVPGRITVWGRAA